MVCNMNNIKTFMNALEAVQASQGIKKVHITYLPSKDAVVVSTYTSEDDESDELRDERLNDYIEGHYRD